MEPCALYQSQSIFQTIRVHSTPWKWSRVSRCFHLTKKQLSSDCAFPFPMNKTNFPNIRIKCWICGSTQACISGINQENKVETSLFFFCVYFCLSTSGSACLAVCLSDLVSSALIRLCTQYNTQYSCTLSIYPVWAHSMSTHNTQYHYTVLAHCISALHEYTALKHSIHTQYPYTV